MRDLSTFLVLPNGRTVFNKDFWKEVIQNNEPELTDSFLSALDQDLGANPDLAQTLFAAIQDKAFDPSKPGHEIAVDALLAACCHNPKALAEKTLLLARMRLIDPYATDRKSALALIRTLIEQLPAHMSRVLETENLVRDLAKTTINAKASPQDQTAARDCLSALMRSDRLRTIGIHFAERTLSCFRSADALASLALLPLIVRADQDCAETALDVAAEGLNSRDPRVQLKALGVIEEITAINRVHDFTALGAIVPLTATHKKKGARLSPVQQEAENLRNRLITRRPGLNHVATLFYEEARRDLGEPLGKRLCSFVSGLIPRRSKPAPAPQKTDTCDPSP